MSIYVDSMRASFGRMVMCHMVADSREELLAMADVIGVARRWIQKPGAPDEHFDICLAKRKQALALGAMEISTRELIHILRRKRSGPPEGRDETNT
jgi:hypothetical protein